MVTKLESSKAIILKVIADMDLDDQDLKISDMISWVGESIEKIGAVSQYNKLVSGESEDLCILQIDGYQLKLPCNIEKLISVLYAREPEGKWLPVRTSTNTFDRWGHCHKHGYRDTLFFDGNSQLSNAERHLLGNIGPMTPQMSLNSVVRRNNCLDYTGDITYSVKPGWLNFNTAEGYLKIVYTAMPVDEDGYPMVPQIASVTEAVLAYVMMKISFSKFIKGDMPQFIYNELKSNWTNWRKTLYLDLVNVNLDGMQTLQNIWVRQMPDMRAAQTFYDNIGEQDRMYDVTRRYGNNPYRSRSNYGYMW